MFFRPLALLASLNVALAIQVVFEPLNVSITSRTIVDALNSDPDYTSLLTLLQRARLIPTLNRLNGSTLFAPTNDAIERHPFWKDMLINDNVQEKLRQQLFYHLINYTVSPEMKSPTALKTLHYPHAPVNPPSREPPPNPPWMPVPGGTLGGEPQRLRIGARGEDGYVGVDAFINGGARIVKGQVDAGNGAVLGISEVLEPPPDLGVSAPTGLRMLADASFQLLFSRSTHPCPSFTTSLLPKSINS